MDRLHYEKDPCIRFDSERKVWIYLHRDRSEDDFDEEGTKNTRKWASRRKKPGDDEVSARCPGQEWDLFLLFDSVRL